MQESRVIVVFEKQDEKYQSVRNPHSRVKLRPHIKTHKTVEISRMQLDDDGSDVCIGAIASTIPEVMRFMSELFEG